MRGFPPGLYQAAPFVHLSIAVVRELPTTRDTLLLRLLGAGRVLRQAIAELKMLPEDAREPLIALPILVRCRLEIPEDPAQRTDDDEEFLMSTQDILEVWEQKVKEAGLRQGLRQGLQQGVEKGLQRSLIAAYETRFGAIRKDLRAAIERTHDEATLDGWLKVIVARSADEIAATLLRR
jgi:flagellar biosynthesis/type III secretory pathway protein FliH